MVAWSVELSEFDITFSPRGAIKSQILADFLLELTTPAEENSEQPWTLSVDGASNIRGSGAGVELEGTNGVLIEQSLRFAFKANNNQAEYEALLAGNHLQIKSRPAKWIIVAIDYFTKWIEAEAHSNISADQVKKFYWRKIICRFRLPKYIVSDNGNQFASEKVIDFYKEKGIQNTFIYVEHPQANGQAESANKVILRAIKRRITSKGEGWVAHLLPILWSYHTTPQSSTGEVPFTMVYGTDAMIPAEINPPSWRRDTLTLEENSETLEENLDLVQELKDKAHFREFVSKQRAARRYNTRVIARRFKEGDLVLKRPMGKDKGGKLAANWEGPFRINEAFEGGAYRLETMEGEVLHRTWNVANLRFYYS
ncbi:protein NYNRIN [Trifolium repens]|nr:protein NYNRIN [Trifolium repens]